MDIDKKLGKIRPVAAPPFLFTRVQAGIGESRVSRKWQLSAAMGFALLVLLNIYVIAHSRQQRTENIETVVSGMMLSGSNDLYDE